MKNNILKTAIATLFLLTSTSMFSKALNAKFSYAINCRTVTLVDSSSGTVSIDRYLWDFGDGSYGYTGSNTHQFKSNGTYRVLLVIFTNDSSQGDYNDSAELQITINCNDCDIQAYFGYQPDLLKDNKIKFENMTLAPGHYNSTWDFGYTGNGGSSLKNPVHTFPSAGYFYVKLRVSYYDSLAAKNCYDSITQIIMTKKLFARFTYSVDSVNCRTVTFHDSTKYRIDSVEWQFGDGNYGSGRNITHTYPGNNMYFMMQWVHYYDSALGRKNIDTVMQYIDLRGCNLCLVKAAIQLDGDSTKPFSGTLYNYSSGNITKHHWDFGDGGTSTQVAPVHTYAGPGRYTITYVATDTIKNCSDTDRVSFKIDSLGYLKRKAFTLTVVDRTTDVKKIVLKSDEAFKVYPNPAQQYLKVLSAVNTYVTIYNVLGEIVSSANLIAGEEQSIDVSNWANGLYFIRTNQGQSLKFLVE